MRVVVVLLGLSISSVAAAGDPGASTCRRPLPKDKLCWCLLVEQGDAVAPGDQNPQNPNRCEPIDAKTIPGFEIWEIGNGQQHQIYAVAKRGRGWVGVAMLYWEIGHGKASTRFRLKSIEMRSIGEQIPVAVINYRADEDVVSDQDH